VTSKASVAVAALRQLLATPVPLTLHEPWQSLGLGYPKIKAVDGLGKMQIGIDTGDNDARVDGENLDADQRHPHIGVDNQSFVENQIEYVR
jgi:hypothetical protein